MSSYRSDAPEYKEPVALDPKGLDAAGNAFTEHQHSDEHLTAAEAVISAYLAASPSVVREIGEPVAQLGGAPDDLRNLIKITFADMTIERMNEVSTAVIEARDPALTEPTWQKPGRAAQAQAGEKPDFPADEQSGETSHVAPAPVQEAVARCCSSISPCSWQRHNGMDSVCPTCTAATSPASQAPATPPVPSPSGVVEALREALAVLHQTPERYRSKRHKCAIGGARLALAAVEGQAGTNASPKGGRSE